MRWVMANCRGTVVSDQACPAMPRAGPREPRAARPSGIAQHMVIEQGNRRRRTTLELILLALRARTIEGDHKAFSAFHDLLVRYGPRDTKRRGGFIFMRESLSAEEQDLQSKRVQDLEQDRDQTGSR
jgi:hypothetical protein